jgi:hypothetical protein
MIARQSMAMIATLDLAGRHRLYCWHQERCSFTLLFLLTWSRRYGEDRASRLTRNARSETLFGTGSQTGAAPAPDARLVLDRLGEWLNTVSPTVARSGRETQR